MITGKGGFIGGFLSRNLKAENLVIHCASAQSYDEDLSLAKNVFNQACKNQSPVVFLSSISVYGEVSEKVVTEEVLPVGQTSYAKAKWDIEALLGSYKVNTLTLRLPGVVGFGAHDIFLSRALASIRKGERIKAYNPESLFNNLVHVSDIAGFIQKWHRNQRDKKDIHHIVNLGCKDPITIREVISLLGGEADFYESPKTSFLISIEKAVSIGFEPSTVTESLKSYVSDS